MELYIHCRVLSIEEKLKDTSTSYETKLQVEEKKHRDAVVCASCSLYGFKLTIYYTIAVTLTVALKLYNHF